MEKKLFKKSQNFVDDGTRMRKCGNIEYDIVNTIGLGWDIVETPTISDLRNLKLFILSEGPPFQTQVCILQSHTYIV